MVVDFLNHLHLFIINSNPCLLNLCTALLSSEGATITAMEVWNLIHSSLFLLLSHDACTECPRVTGECCLGVAKIIMEPPFNIPRVFHI
jgi:hypothetical protein